MMDDDEAGRLAYEAELLTSRPDHVARALAEARAEPPMRWPKQREVGRQEDMGHGNLRVLLDGDNDVCVVVWDGARSASVEFCNGGGGGGRSMRTRAALIELMRAIEADNAETPAVAWPPACRETPNVNSQTPVR